MAHQRGGLAVAGGAAKDHQPRVRPALGGQRIENILVQPQPGEIAVALRSRLRQQPQVQEVQLVGMPGDLAPEGGYPRRHARQFARLPDGELRGRTLDQGGLAAAAIPVIVNPLDAFHGLIQPPLRPMGELPPPPP